MARVLFSKLVGIFFLNLSPDSCFVVCVFCFHCVYENVLIAFVVDKKNVKVFKWSMENHFVMWSNDTQIGMGAS